MPTYKLYYFNIRGLAEPARFLFHLAGVPYEDVRYDRQVEWPKHKEETPWGQLPVLEVDGKKLAQSSAIFQYLAKQFGYNGKDDWEAAQIQELLGSIMDFNGQLRPAFVIQDEEEKKKKFASIFAEQGVPYFERLQKRLATNGSGYFVGNALTVADVAFFTFFEMLGALNDRFAPDLMAKFPKLGEFVDRISAQPKIKEWIEKRPKTDF